MLQGHAVVGPTADRDRRLDREVDQGAGREPPTTARCQRSSGNAVGRWWTRRASASISDRVDRQEVRALGAGGEGGSGARTRGLSRSGVDAVEHEVRPASVLVHVRDWSSSAWVNWRMFLT
jgi:hypothetical protein